MPDTVEDEDLGEEKEEKEDSDEENKSKEDMQLESGTDVEELGNESDDSPEIIKIVQRSRQTSEENTHPETTTNHCHSQDQETGICLSICLTVCLNNINFQSRPRQSRKAYRPRPHHHVKVPRNCPSMW